MNLYVGNLLFDTSEADLKTLFEEFGEVTEVRLIMDKFSGKSKGFGFIEMPSKDEAEKAINELNGKDLNGRDLTVNVAKPKTDSRGGRGRGGPSRGGYGGSSRGSSSRDSGNSGNRRY